MRVAFRCNASAQVGGGHVMRCLASAQTFAWGGWNIEFVVSGETVATIPALVRSNHAVSEWSGQWPQADVIVLDSYDLDASDEADARATGATVVAFEDRPSRTHAADIVLDPTPGRRAVEYSGLVTGRLLVGAEFAQLRHEWLLERGRALSRDRSGKVESILVSMGATDPENASERALLALREAGFAGIVKVVLGSSASHHSLLEKMLQENEQLIVDPTNLPEIVSGVDLAIGAGGSSCFERACLGTPSIVMPIAENQLDLLSAFARAGAVRSLEGAQARSVGALAVALKAALSDAGWRRTAAGRAAALSDGRGTQRLLAALGGKVESIAETSAELRIASAGDADWLLELQRQPKTRQFAETPRVPTDQEHEAWFSSVMSDPSRLLAIIMSCDVPVGMLRLDTEHRRNVGAAATQLRKPQLTVSVAIDEKHQRSSFGTAALRLARRIAPGADLFAHVLPANRASQNLFAKAGFVQASDTHWKSNAL